MKNWILIAGLVSILLISGCVTSPEEPGYAVVVDNPEVKVVDTDGDIIGIDEATRVITTIEYEHHEIHSGNTFSEVETVELPNAAVRDIQITTSNTTEWAHFFFSFSTESEVEWYFYRGVNILATDSVVFPFNSDHNSLHPSTIGMGISDAAGVVAANAKTAVAASTEIYHGFIGAGKDAGGYDHGHEIILRQNEAYSIRFIAGAAGYVNYHIDWYEHTNKG